MLYTMVAAGCFITLDASGHVILTPLLFRAIIRLITIGHASQPLMLMIDTLPRFSSFIRLSLMVGCISPFR